MINHHKIGLSFSGGGYRAAAFHIGTLSKLKEMGVIEKVDVLSTISGGSITGACFCLTDKNYEDFEKELKNSLITKSVIRYVLLSRHSILAYLIAFILLSAFFYFPFTSHAWLSPILIGVVVILICFFQYKIWDISAIIEKAYDSFFYKKATLKDLCNQPLLAIGSTNIQTCRPFTFSKNKMEDSSYAYRKHPIKFLHNEFPVSRAVMASSCVPFAFTPVSINKEYFVNPSDAEEVDPQLIDGGVYDNQGIQKITQPGSSYECDIIITSDAGNKLPFSKSYNNVFVLLIRTMDVFMTRIKNFQMAQNVYSNTKYANKSIAYFSLGWDIENCIPGFVSNLINGKIASDILSSHKIPIEWLKNPQQYKTEITELIESNVGYNSIIKNLLKPEQLEIARSVGTNLACLSKDQVSFLSTHAANLTELQVKLYCPTLFSKSTSAFE